MPNILLILILLVLLIFVGIALSSFKPVNRKKRPSAPKKPRPKTEKNVPKPKPQPKMAVPVQKKTEAETTVIEWLVGVDNEESPERGYTRDRLVKHFNQTHKSIQLRYTKLPSAENSIVQTLQSDHAPDLIGPLGDEWQNTLLPSLADLSAIKGWNTVDTTLYGDEAMLAYQQEGKQIGLPFGEIPAVLYINKTLFDSADLPLPPQEKDRPYPFYGEYTIWNEETLQHLSGYLTLDHHGRNAHDTRFDPAHLIQQGYTESGSEFATETVAMGLASMAYADALGDFSDEWTTAIAPTGSSKKVTFHILDRSHKKELALYVLNWLVNEEKTAVCKLYDLNPVQ